MAQPQVEADPDAARPESESGVKRMESNSSQPAALLRPLGESARMASVKDRSIHGIDYDVNAAAGFRKGPVVPETLQPEFDSITPTEGDDGGGTVVQIQGTNLAGATVRALGGVALTSVTVTDTLITGTTGAHAVGKVPLVVTTPDGSFTVVDAFEYKAL